eukprot:CAMPEP_0184337422 /NCGR_PEP_ID=MMETSP1089-20130417/5824_1 /TAXON_ID=38269 ORGANISM="Gloeochaete wittrockiana, Strain SAG46.84" /NCGR_SAMPLE_ID=MMETSP1089 /ASSEMBLY_ACC=CAM_ASM_000445 /LENGTH=65 /DNA_ID=CAMNT_0026663153 /DNA_START=63 /DNA_END=257 /DNA_ORIENTATION=+
MTSEDAKMTHRYADTDMCLGTAEKIGGGRVGGEAQAILRKFPSHFTSLSPGKAHRRNKDWIMCLC